MAKIPREKGNMKYDEASTEPLEIIEANECNGFPFLATKRFRAVFNVIYRLREELDMPIERRQSETDGRVPKWGWLCHVLRCAGVSKDKG
ncbi:hypothetical protein MUP59_08245 [Candidatus Bathyarchaeota archaeon]|nr:hypothetical protein [Candidatus Bathyarchaeota archaeon]